MASNFYRQQDAPRYIMGHALEIAFVSLGFIASIVLILAYNRINNTRQKRIEAGAAGQVSIEELSAQGDKAVTWRYMY